MSGVIGKVVLGAGAGAAGVAAANNGLLDDFSLDSITDLASEVRYEREHTETLAFSVHVTRMLHASAVLHLWPSRTGPLVVPRVFDLIRVFLIRWYYPYRPAPISHL